MSSEGSGGERNPFEAMFGDLARLLGGAQSGPLNWDVARQVAVTLASDGSPEPNVEPLERIRLEELARVAELHVSAASGLTVPSGLTTPSRSEWAVGTLDAWRPLLEALASALSQEDAGPADPGNPLAGMTQWIAPVMLGMQVGGMVGYLAKRSLGLYDLPVPRPAPAVAVVAANIRGFADDWSLPLDELSLYVLIDELTRAAVLARPHVASRFSSLLTEYVSGFRPDGTALEARLADLDISDPSQLPSALTDPQALLGAMQTPEQKRTLAALTALVSAFVGYVDNIVAAAAGKTISTAGVIAEAVKRRRVEETDAERLVEQLLGLELTQPVFDRGDAFVRGVLERAGEPGLARLWHSANELPTPAEVDAPGLWLERIDLPQA